VSVNICDLKLGKRAVADTNFRMAKNLSVKDITYKLQYCRAICA
jgi:hypothetical protein